MSDPYLFIIIGKDNNRFFPSQNISTSYPEKKENWIDKLKKNFFFFQNPSLMKSCSIDRWIILEFLSYCPIRFLLNIFPMLISNWLLNYSLIQVSPSTREMRIPFDVSPENFNRISPREFNATMEKGWGEREREERMVNPRKFWSLRSFNEATEKDLGSEIRVGRGWSLWIPTIGRHLRTVGRTILGTAARATRTAIVPRFNL